MIDPAVKKEEPIHSLDYIIGFSEGILESTNNEKLRMAISRLIEMIKEHQE